MVSITALMGVVACLAATAVAAPPNPQLVELGRKFFYEPLMSADGTVSCATCHDPNRGFTDGRSTAVGINGGVGNFNSPTVIEAAKLDLLFWDGRTNGQNGFSAASVQSLQPLVNPLEMGNQNNNSPEIVARRLNRIPGYRNASVAMTGRGVSKELIGLSIDAFERSLISRGAPVDKRMEGYSRSLSPAAERGYQIFQAAGCAECHAGESFSDGRFHNTGVSFFTGDNLPGRAGILPVQNRTPDTIRAFKTPTLREIARTAPYTHSGAVGTLEEVVANYNRGWQRNGLKDARQDARVRPLGLSSEQQVDLVAFLKEGLSSPNYPKVTRPSLPR